MWPKKYRDLFLLWLMVYGVLDVSAKQVKRNILIDNIHSGIKYAGKILGIDTASDVAELVSRAFATSMNKKTSFQQTNSQPNSENRNDLYEKQTEQQPTFMTGLFRLMGMDSSKLGALALNGLIFIAQMVRDGINTINDALMSTMTGWYGVFDVFKNKTKLFKIKPTNCTTVECYQPPPSPNPLFQV